VHDPRIGQPAASAQRFTSRGLPQAVREAPYRYVAQSLITSVPLNPAAKRKTPFRLSTYVLAHGRQLIVMPGGVLNLGADPPADRVGLAADVIVMADQSGGPGELADLEASVASGSQSTLPGSRAAESLFWLGRYLERAESAARMLHIVDDVALEEIPARDRPRWLPVWRGLLEATGHAEEKITARANPHATFGRDLPWRMTLDPSNPSSLLSSVRAATENARQLRDYVSPEAWSLLTRLLDRLDQLARQPRKPTRLSTRQQQPPASLAIQAVLTDINAFLGTAERTMLHDAGWHFMLLGTQLERAIMTCSALRHVLGALDHDARTHPDPVEASLVYRDNPELSALLRMLGSQDAYRRLYQTRSQPRFVAELFLQQPDAPRSILQTLQVMRASLAAIRTDTHDPIDEPSALAIERALTFTAGLRLDRSFGINTHENEQKLSRTLADLLDLLWAVHPRLSDQYFNHQARLNGADHQAELTL
jgi:uncharacterized alpha-E superfamily protein